MAALLLLFVSGVSAQTDVGLAAGAALGWPQDVTIERRGSHGETTQVIHEDSLPVRRGAVLELGLNSWSEVRRALGVRLDLVQWSNEIQVSKFPTQPPQGLREEHTAFLVFLSGRAFLDHERQSYVYGALGGGLGTSRLRRTKAAIGPVLSLLSGVSLSLRERWSGFVEGAYSITRDFDALSRDNGTTYNLEFSGHPSLAAAKPLLGPHMDSRFASILLGLRWTLPFRRKEALLP